MVLISQVAHLSKKAHVKKKADLRKSREAPAKLDSLLRDRDTILSMDSENLEEAKDPKDKGFEEQLKREVGEKSPSLVDVVDSQKPLIDTSERPSQNGRMGSTERIKLLQLLKVWEEPDRRSAGHKNATIAAVLRFRNALALVSDNYPFSYDFGLAQSRESCVDSAQDVYNRLLLTQRDFKYDEGEEDDDRAFVLNFETLASIAIQKDGSINQAKTKDLIKVFRPNRDGSLTLLDFVRSIDSVYKEFRLLQASIENSAQIDRAFESIFNIVFYTLIVVIIMSQLGFDPLALFLSMSSVILAFAFMIGSASSKYFEGLLFILVRRPYNIGDLINVNGIESETGLMGAVGWIVQNVTLFETTMTWLPTMETATVANGALASSRIVNWARSPNARFVINLFFPIETKSETIELFRGSIEEYMKSRPREWLALNALRVLSIQTDKGYMLLELVVQHREAWQNPGVIYDSRGNLVNYCNEVQKLLGMQYRAPAMPIDIRADQIPLQTQGQQGGVP